MGSEVIKYRKLVDITTKIGSGATPTGGSKVYLDTGTIALVRSQNIYDLQFEHAGKVFITPEDAKSLANVTLQECDILINITGDSVTRVAMVPNNLLPARVNQHVAIIRPNLNDIAPKYLLYFLYSPAIKSKLLQWSKAGATRKALTKGMLQDLKVPIPSLSKQVRIANILGTLDDKIDLNRKMNRTLEAMARALFKSWFVDFDPVHAKMAGQAPVGVDAQTAALFPDSLVDSELGEIPEGWEVKPIKEVIKVTPRYKLSKGDVTPYLKMANAPEEGHYPHDWYDREFTGSGSKFANGDTLMAKITPCLENGKTAFVDFLQDDEPIAWGSTEYLVLRSKKPFPLEYSYYLARSRRLRRKAIKSMSGTSGRQRVSVRGFKKFKIVVPPAQIAQRFGDLARDIMTKIRLNNEESNNLAEIRDTLLPKLLSGELSVDVEA